MPPTRVFVRQRVCAAAAIDVAAEGATSGVGSELECVVAGAAAQALHAVVDDNGVYVSVVSSPSVESSTGVGADKNVVGRGATVDVEETCVGWNVVEIERGAAGASV